MSAPAQNALARDRGLGVWLVLATAAISGVSTYVNGFAVSGTSSDVFVTFRNATVALLIAPAALLASRGAGERLRGSDWGRLVVIGLIGGAIPFLLFFRGLQLATAAGGATTASFLYRTLAIWAVALGVLVLRERFRWRVAAGAGLLLAGNALLLTLRGPVWTDGTLLVLVATLLWAGEYTLSKRALADLDPGTVALGRMGFGALFLLGFLAVSGELTGVVGFRSVQWEWLGISALLLAAFVATWYAGLKRIELGTASAILVLGYPVTFLVANLASGPITAVGPIAGAAVVAAGVLVVMGPDRLREAGRVVVDAARSRPEASG